MNNTTTQRKPLADFSLLTTSRTSHCDINVIIYYVISGSMRVTTAETELTLTKGTFMILDSFQLHSTHIEEAGTIMQFLIDFRQVADTCDVSDLQFSGDSLHDTSPRELALKNLLDKCVPYYQTRQSRDARMQLKLNSLYYELAEILISFFAKSVSGDDSEQTGRSSELLIQDMISYLHANYRYPLKLNDLAKQFYLSPAYISRFFKKNLGVNFTKYLNNLRLDAAVSRLRGTDETLTRIAMDCGFSNLSAFNTAFRERYQMTPKEYRHTVSMHTDFTAEEADGTHAASGQAAALLADTPAGDPEDYAVTIPVTADTGSYSILTRNWNKLINIGSASMLLERDIQDQILFLCRTLNFQYVRVWDLYANEMHLNAGDSTRACNFSRLDACLDFLTSHNLKLYLELGFKPYILVKDYKNYTYNEERIIPFAAAHEYGAFIRHLMTHLQQRYGLQTISSWIFEIWGDPRWFPDGDPSVYFSFFDEAYQAVKSVSPASKVGGNYDRHYKRISYERMIRAWSTRSIQPDFLSIYCYESFFHQEFTDVSDYFQIWEEDMDIEHNFELSEYLKIRKEVMLRCGMVIPVYCSEWNSTVINANPLNDSVAKGAYVMKDAMALNQELDMLGYWFGTDLFVNEDEPPQIINGRCGLITHQGICKPSYWALWMLNQLEDYLLYQDAHTMITMNEYGRYVITLHNYKSMDYQYYLLQEQEITIESIPQLFSDHRKLLVEIRIRGIKNGTYYVETHSLNAQHGCVQDEWKRTGKTASQSPVVSTYLNHISRPQVTFSQHVIKDQTLLIRALLEPQEIQMIRAVWSA